MVYAIGKINEVLATAEAIYTRKRNERHQESFDGMILEID
jgi:hypothetical protein